MVSPLDPYRTLGLMAGASVAEIKRAYRDLAKRYHPDSAGPAALPRFLAVQAAYETLLERAGRGRSGAGAPRTPGAPPSSRAASAGWGGTWRRDPRWARTRRDDGPAGGARPPGADRADPGGRRESADGPGTTPNRPGAASRQAGGPAEGGASRRPRRGPRRATMGSTSYDDAGEAEPGWEGASWYGPASGTYWTLNPREYADPRKHGPEYQARARRAGGGDDEGSEGAADEASARAPSGSPRPRPAAEPRRRSPAETAARRTRAERPAGTTPSEARQADRPGGVPGDRPPAAPAAPATPEGSAVPAASTDRPSATPASDPAEAAGGEDLVGGEALVGGKGLVGGEGFARRVRDLLGRRLRG